MIIKISYGTWHTQLNLLVYNEYGCAICVPYSDVMLSTLPQTPIPELDLVAYIYIWHIQCRTVTQGQLEI